MLHRTHLVQIFQIEECLIEIITVAGLISHRPIDDAGVVLVAPIHILHPRHMCIVESEVISQCSTLAEVIIHTVRFNICLVAYIDSVLVAQLIEICRLRIVAATYCIKVVGLHKFYVGFCLLSAYDVSRMLVVFVNVHTLDLDGLAIYKQLVTNDLNSPWGELELHLFALTAIFGN